MIVVSPIIIPIVTGPMPARAAITSGLRRDQAEDAGQGAVMTAAGTSMPADRQGDPPPPPIRRPRSAVSAMSVTPGLRRESVQSSRNSARSPTAWLDEDLAHEVERRGAAADRLRADARPGAELLSRDGRGGSPSGAVRSPSLAPAAAQPGP